MNTGRVKALFKREIFDILRDKKTLIMMVVIPLLLYPILIIGMTLVMTAISSDQTESIYTVALVEAEEDTVQGINQVINEKSEDIGYKVTLTNSTNPEADLQNQVIDAYITVTKEDGQEKFVINYLEAKGNSSTAASAAITIMEYYREDLRVQKITEMGLDENEILYPISVETQSLSTNEETMGFVLGAAIPVLMVLSILLGAIYPAIDVTAGERERGTLETLITLPVTNFEMLTSKFLAVSAVACVSAILNIVSMAGAFGFMGSMLMEETGMGSIEWASFAPALLFTLAVVLVFALFVSAVCMCVSVFAKSFKEANNYITPVMLVFIFVSYAGIIPNLQLTSLTAAIPILNVSLMLQNVFQFQNQYALYGIVLLTNVVYSFLTVWVLGRLYNSEAILFAEGFTSVKIFSKRSEMKKGQMPGYGDVILLICAVLMMIFYIGQYAQIKWGFPGVAVQQAIIMLAPVLYAWYLKTDGRKLFSISIPKVRHVIGIIFLWAGTYAAVCLLSYFLSPVMKESVETVNQAFAGIVGQPFVLLLLVMALMPAIGEELLFRGFVFGALKEKGKLLTAMIMTSVIFAIFHMSLIKFFTTAVLGFFIVLAVQKTGSIFIGMLFHFINNAVSVVIMKYPDVVRKIPMLGAENLKNSDILILVGIAVIGIWVGLLIIGPKSGKVLKKQ